MSEWNYTKCSKPFESVEEALEFMISKSLYLNFLNVYGWLFIIGYNTIIKFMETEF